MCPCPRGAPGRGQPPRLHAKARGPRQKSGRFQLFIPEPGFTTGRRPRHGSTNNGRYAKAKDERSGKEDMVCPPAAGPIRSLVRVSATWTRRPRDAEESDRLNHAPVMGSRVERGPTGSSTIPPGSCGTSSCLDSPEDDRTMSDRCRRSSIVTAATRIYDDEKR